MAKVGILGSGKAGSADYYTIVYTVPDDVKFAVVDVYLSHYNSLSGVGVVFAKAVPPNIQRSGGAIISSLLINIPYIAIAGGRTDSDLLGSPNTCAKCVVLGPGDAIAVGELSGSCIVIGIEHV